VRPICAAAFPAGGQHGMHDIGPLSAVGACRPTRVRLFRGRAVPGRATARGFAVCRGMEQSDCLTQLAAASWLAGSNSWIGPEGITVEMACL